MFVLKVFLVKIGLLAYLVSFVTGLIFIIGAQSITGAESQLVFLALVDLSINVVLIGLLLGSRDRQVQKLREEKRDAYLFFQGRIFNIFLWVVRSRGFESRLYRFLKHLNGKAAHQDFQEILNHLDWLIEIYQQLRGEAGGLDQTEDLRKSLHEKILQACRELKIPHEEITPRYLPVRLWYRETK